MTRASGPGLRAGGAVGVNGAAGQLGREHGRRGPAERDWYDYKSSRRSSRIGTEQRRALVVTHTPTEGPGTLGQWLPAYGLQLEVLRPWQGDVVPASADGYQALIVMGGPQQAYDDDSAAWLRATKDLLARAVADRVPVLCICLGAQLLAEAAGGVVEPGEHGPELGARLVGKRDVAGADPLMWDTPMSWICVQWHWDAVTELPPGSTLLASSPKYDNQMFRLGDRAWGLQFHIEVTESMVRDWAGELEGGTALADRTVAELDEIEQLWRPVLSRFAAVVRGEDPRPRALPLL